MKRPRLRLPRETQRLVLCPPDPAHARQVQDAIEETFDDLHRWMPWARQLQPFHETKAFLEYAEEQLDAGEDFGVLAFLKGNGSFVLASGLHPRNWEVPSFEIGYWCRSSMQGRGYATEVVRSLSAAAFLEMGARRVEIRCDSRNQASRRVAERAGFPFEAELVNDDRANDGSLRNTIVYALVQATFRSGE